VQNSQLRKLANSNSDPKEIWAAVRDFSNPPQSKCILSSYSPDVINNYFASIASDDDYNLYDILGLMNDITEDDSEAMRCNKITEPEVERLLRSLKNTAPGNDNIPLLGVQKLFIRTRWHRSSRINSSLISGTVPSSWLTSVVTPVPKTRGAKNLSEFRPISVTPILSRLTEKILVFLFTC
jgi:hypothetical protein